MSQRLNVTDLKADTTRICAALNICPEDDRFLAWLNQFEEMANNQGRWFNTVQESQFCVTTGCITLPREVATIERVEVCGDSLEIVNSWYSYTRGISDYSACSCCWPSGRCACSTNSCGCSHLRLRDHGTAASFATTLGINKRLRVYPGNASDVGKKIVFQGYDKNGVWVRTLIGGVMSDGEEMTLTLPFSDSVTIWGPGAPKAVRRDATVQRTLVYELNIDDSNERLLAVYEPSETRPLYRVAFIPNFGQACCGCTSTNEDGSTTRTRTVRAIVSLQHIELTSDYDWCLFTNKSAYKAGMIAMKAYEEGDVAKGDFYFYGTQAGSRNARGATRVVNRGGAIPLLNAELRKMTGDRVNAYVRLEETDRAVRDMIGFI